MNVFVRILQALTLKSLSNPLREESEIPETGVGLFCLKIVLTFLTLSGFEKAWDFGTLFHPFGAWISKNSFLLHAWGLIGTYCGIFMEIGQGVWPGVVCEWMNEDSWF